MKLLEPDQKPVRPPRAAHAFSDVRYLPWKDCRPHPMAKDVQRFEPFGPGFLSPILAIAHQSRLGWKPFAFLLLPSELRNKVYAEYLTCKDYHLYWTMLRIGTDGDIAVLELCQTSRQLLFEVLPMYLDTKILEFNASRSLRSPRLGRQPLLRLLLHFSEIDIKTANRCFIRLRVWGVEPNLSIDYIDNPYCNSPIKGRSDNLNRPDQFEDLVKLLKDDAPTQDFGLEELAVSSSTQRVSEATLYAHSQVDPLVLHYNATCQDSSPILLYNRY